MTQMVCKVCKKIICEDINKIIDVKWISCPYCNREPFLNPYFEEKND